MVSRKHGIGTAAVVIGAILLLSGMAITGVEGASSGKPSAGLENPVNIVRSAGGGSDITRTWVAHSDDYISQWVENNGLKGLQITVHDITSKPGVIVFSEQIIFAYVGAYPTGVATMGDIDVLQDHTYKWVFTSSGRAGTSAQYFWHLQEAGYPVPDFTIGWMGTVLKVDASPSYDPDGLIVEYAWNWNDGTSIDFGIEATHQYEDMVAQKWVTLTVTDSQGLVSAISYPIPPQFPYLIVGRTVSWDGALLPGTLVTITDLRTGASVSGTSDLDYAYYMIDFNRVYYGWSVGDVIDITATYGSTLLGSTHVTLTDWNLPYIMVDITLYPAAP